MRKLNVLFFTAVMLFLSACSTNTPLAGKYKGELRFSAWELLTAELILLEDSTFYYSSRPDENSEFTAYAGQWRLQGKTLRLDAGHEWQLWLKPGKNGLEVLDVDQKPVKGSNKLIMKLNTESELFSAPANIKGSFRHYADASYFSFCGSGLQLLVITEGANAELERLYFQQLETDETEALTVSVFGRVVREQEQENASMKLSISRLNHRANCR